MRINQITSHTNKYSSNKVQQPDAKINAAPNFGLKIIYDEADVISVVGNKAKARVIKHTIEELEKKLVQRFQMIFKRSEKLQLMSKDVRSKWFLDTSGAISPTTLIDNWYTLELKPTFINENGIIGVELMDNKGVNEFGTARHSDVTMAAMMALSNSLDAYAEKKIGIALAQKMKA